MTAPGTSRVAWAGLPLGLLCAAGLLCWALGSLWWPLDLGNHQPLLWAATAAAGAAVTVRRFRWSAGFAVVGCLWLLRWGWPGGLAPTPDPGRTRPLRVLLANVYTGNPDHQALLDLIAEEDPDVVGLLEVDPGWLVDLGPLRSGWPHHLEVPRTDNFGIALYSRVPGSQVASVSLGPVPSLELVLGDLPLLLTHPVPPIGADRARRRDQQLAAVAGWIDRRGEVWVVAGDLNATPWSAAFPARYRGGLLWGSWPAELPGLLRIPIDHVLVGAALPLVDRRLGPPIGSDHLPVIADLRY